MVGLTLKHRTALSRDHSRNKRMDEWKRSHSPFQFLALRFFQEQQEHSWLNSSIELRSNA